ncbi:hypothetical protein IOD13_11940 [Brevibacterium casei]|nr:hypothetical protein [Brevibacterium casei]
MPTFYDPVADAEEASQAPRGLAHASRDFTHPEDAYGVIGDLLAGVRSMRSRSSSSPPATPAMTGAPSTMPETPPPVSVMPAWPPGSSPRPPPPWTVSRRGLNRASQVAGRIAWHPAPPAPAETEMTRVQGPVSRWVNIVFLQSGEADAVLWLIDCDGPDAAIEHLAGFDYGEETTDAAMLNGYVYDTPPTGALDKEARTGEYTLTYNPDLGHVALYRHHQIAPEDSLDTDTPAPTMDPDMGSAGGAASAGTAMGAAGAAAAALSDRGVRATGQKRAVPPGVGR